MAYQGYPHWQSPQKSVTGKKDRKKAGKKAGKKSRQTRGKGVCPEGSCPGDSRPSQRQAKLLAQKQRMTQEEILISQQSFLQVIRAGIQSAKVYGQAVLDGRPKHVLHTMNGAVNLQVTMIKLAVSERSASPNAWDQDAVEMGRAVAQDFVEEVRRFKDALGHRPSARDNEFLKRMVAYADAMHAATIDPSLVAEPRHAKYEGPSGAILDKRVKEGDYYSGASGFLEANHKRDDMVADVHANPAKYHEEHRALRARKKKSGQKHIYVPSNQLVFDIDARSLEPADASQEPDLFGEPGKDQDEDYPMHGAPDYGDVREIPGWKDVQ